MNIIYQDNHLLVVEKPAGLLTQDSGTGGPNLEDQCRSWLAEKKGKPRVFLHAVHRLDRPVGGLVLFALTSKSLRRLNQAQTERDIEKNYLLVCAGRPEKQKATISNYLKKENFRARLVQPGVKGARRAELRYTLVSHQAERNISLARVELLTGRYHQIRAQFAALKHPLWGDQRYGGPAGKHLGLFAYRLALTHPVTRKDMEWIARPDLDREPWSFFSDSLDSFIHESPA